MKRAVTIEGNWKREGSGPADECLVIRDRGERQAFVYVNHPDIKVTVEDIPDPLPTTPGTHLVAKVTRYLPDGTYPETDTVVIVVDTDPESGDINYRSTTPVRGFYVHRASDIKAWKRLDIPDPEVAP